MRLLCEANDIIKTVKLVLENTNMDKDTKKLKIGGILSLMEFNQE